MRLSKSGSGSGTVRVAARDLESFILKKFHDIQSVEVRIAGGKIHVNGSGDFLLIHTNFTVTANLEPLTGSKLVLANADILFDGRPADDLSRKALLQTLNPVVDLNRDLKLYGAIDVKSVRLLEGVLEASGDTRIPDKPRETPAAGTEHPTHALGNSEYLCKACRTTSLN